MSISLMLPFSSFLVSTFKPMVFSSGLCRKCINELLFFCFVPFGYWPEESWKEEFIHPWFSHLVCVKHYLKNTPSKQMKDTLDLFFSVCLFFSIFCYNSNVFFVLFLMHAVKMETLYKLKNVINPKTLWSMNTQTFTKWSRHCLKLFLSYFQDLKRFQAESFDMRPDIRSDAMKVSEFPQNDWTNEKRGGGAGVFATHRDSLSVWEIPRSRYTHVTGRRRMSAVVFACRFWGTSKWVRVGHTFGSMRAWQPKCGCSKTNLILDETFI